MSAQTDGSAAIPREVSVAARRLEAAGLAPDGPDEMGRELASGPAAVEGALSEVERVSGEVDRLRREAARTVLVGTGASLAVARIAAPALRVAGRQGVGGGVERPLLVRESTAVALGGSDGEELRSGDLVVVVSQSGTSPETVAAARLAVGGGCPLLAITADGSSALAGLATVTLLTPSGREDGAATKSALAALATLLAIGGALAPDGPTRRVVADRLRAAVLDLDGPARVAPVLAAGERTWLLGLGPGVGLAAAAGLLWHEKVHRLAFPTSVSEFRHGPVEAVRARDAILLVDVDAPLPARAAYLDLLRRELRRVGAVLVEVVAGLPDSSFGIRVASETPAIASLEALLRIQQIARATAVAAGTYQDGFRVLRAIVTAAPSFGV
jgi:glucosamine--fructose-6-phosphate aminotransferase (isomerizing)